MRFSRSIGTGLGALVLVAGAAVPALAAVTYPGGGTWSYGVNSEVYSNYHHPTARHKSSVINGYGEYKTAACTNGGTWTYASLRADPNSTDHAYWNNSC